MDPFEFCQKLGMMLKSVKSENRGLYGEQRLLLTCSSRASRSFCQAGVKNCLPNRWRDQSKVLLEFCPVAGKMSMMLNGKRRSRKNSASAALHEDPPPYAGGRNGFAGSREQSFRELKSVLEPKLVFSGANALVAEGDSLALLRELPGQSVSLILTDPPYHATKKSNIYGDTAFSEDRHYIEWMAKYATEWRRVLRPNGSLFCFCDSSMAARLEVMFAKNFNVLSHIVWTKPNDPGFDGWKGKMKKESLRQWYPHSERIIFAEPAVDTNLFRSPFAQMLHEARMKAGFSAHQLTGKIGAHGKVNHGGAVCNWEDGRNTPSREQYEGMRKAILETGKVEWMPAYEDAIRRFNMDASKQFMDVWDFPSVRPYKGKHPAEKPLAMLEHTIAATTYRGDVVLDCFGGGGNTAVAAMKLGRRAVVVEIEHVWAKRIAARVEAHMETEVMLRPPEWEDQPVEIVNKFRSPQLGLFSALK